MPQLLTLSQGRVTYRRTGRGHPLILLHGWGGSSRYWLGTATELADVRTIYALDMPGFGDSPPSSMISSVDRLAELVIEFADAFNIDQFDLNGHSLGAAVAAYIAAHWPARVSRLILSNFSVPSNFTEEYVFLQTYLQAQLTLPLMRLWLDAYQPWINLWRPWIVQAWSSPPLSQVALSRFFHNLPENSRMVSMGIQDFAQMSLRVSIESAASVGDPRLIHALQRIPVPTLLIASLQDRIMPPAGADAAASMIPNCSIAWINECGHVPMIEQPDVYNRILRSFLVPARDVLDLDYAA